jgi:hypothetical protein
MDRPVFPVVVEPVESYVLNNPLSYFHHVFVINYEIYCCAKPVTNRVSKSIAFMSGMLIKLRGNSPIYL